MRWTDMSEKEMIKAWAGEECSRDLMEEYLPMPKQGEESYWNVHETEEEIAEYDFEKVPELKAILGEKLKEEFYRDLILPLAVAALKEKKIIQIEEENENKESNQPLQKTGDEFLIPDFVYEF